MGKLIKALIIMSLAVPILAGILIVVAVQQVTDAQGATNTGLQCGADLDSTTLRRIEAPEPFHLSEAQLANASLIIGRAKAADQPIETVVALLQTSIAASGLLTDPAVPLEQRSGLFMFNTEKASPRDMKNQNEAIDEALAHIGTSSDPLAELDNEEEYDDELDQAIIEAEQIASSLADALWETETITECSTAPDPSSITITSANVTNEEIALVSGIKIHITMAENLRNLLAHAEADGFEFSGWGWRDPATQIRLRKEHCRLRSASYATNYEIYHLPSSQCTRAHGRVGPMTARPGRSQHEIGKAVDFTHNGSVIGSRSSDTFKWMNANANRYGFYNLPAEPWHWSHNGR